MDIVILILILGSDDMPHSFDRPPPRIGDASVLSYLRVSHAAHVLSVDQGVVDLAVALVVR